MKIMTELSDTIESMNSAYYKDRFIAEYAQLAIRTARLSSMVAKYEMNELNFTPYTPIGILKDQLNAMNDYLEIMKKRAEIEDIELPEVVL
jgi:hypothetical protein